jgi:tripartite ATP-independent transporter DctM subunit
LNTGILTAALFGAMMLCLIAGLPLAFSFGGVAVIFILLLMGPNGLFIIISSAFDGWTNYILIAIPLFVLMANFLERSGIARELYDAMYKWIGRLRGGLAIGTIVICAVFAALSGISALATVTMGLIALPSMLSKGYDKRISIGAISAGGTLGILIPPSIVMIFYGAFTETSVGALFMAGIIPGIMLALIFMIYIAVRTHLQPSLAPALPEKYTLKEKIINLKSLILPMILILLVLGVIYTGIATPTEASGIGAFGAFLILVLTRRFTWKVLQESVARTLSITVMGLWIVLGAKSFTHIYVTIGAVDLVSGIINNLAVSPWLIIILMQLILIALGMFIDTLGVMLITIPIFVPLIISMRFDPVWFGILYTINMEMGYITPPFGFNLFYMKSIVEPMGFGMEDVYRSIAPFFFLEMLGLVIVMIFPQLCLWLPSTMMK